ncbi:D-hexose-6-phosphate mutarotase [uncultured Nevskia sp.]|uniref:D-hexose-6-phosphate mutarotase n=1 Tax=uncultured Nevskia sp. TaxID=228950 RepID=UPI0025D6FFB7|nr:D-hexose-6-phosphate mutarotase [uncultured Nevskia sp.]
MNHPDANAAILNLVAADGARISIHRHGAHITSWTPVDGLERLYLSGLTDYRPTAAIRGGIPVIFPQFAAEGPLPKHGFARTASWSFVEAGPVEGGGLSVRFRLEDSDQTRAIWPQAFVAELLATIGGAQLSVSLSVRNRGTAAFSFTAALHTYLAGEDLAAVRVLGLQGLRYRDSANGNVVRLEAGDQVAINGEVDRIYFDAPNELLLSEPRASLRISQQGFCDTVVWNPGAAKGAALSDLDPQGYRRMLCIEAAVVGCPVTLAPGATWSGTQTFDAA